jgi:hypothetical protein
VRKLTEAAIFRILSRRARRLFNAHGIRTTDWLFGLHQSGNLTERYITGVIRRLPMGITEIYFHPAVAADAAVAQGEAQREVEILTGPAIRGALHEVGARLTNFAELARSPRDTILESEMRDPPR